MREGRTRGGMRQGWVRGGGGYLATTVLLFRVRFLMADMTDSAWNESRPLVGSSMNRIA